MSKKDDEEKVPYLVFRTCKAQCFACAQCGYFWGPAHDKLAGQPARFGPEPAAGAAPATRPLQGAADQAGSTGETRRSRA